MARAWRKEFDADVDRLYLLTDDEALRRKLEEVQGLPTYELQGKVRDFCRHGHSGRVCFAGVETSTGQVRSQVEAKPTARCLGVCVERPHPLTRIVHGVTAPEAAPPPTSSFLDTYRLGCCAFGIRCCSDYTSPG